MGRLPGPRAMSYFAFLLWPALGAAGGLCLLVGVGAAFRHAGEWSNWCVEAGSLLLIAAWVSNAVSLAAGVVAWVRDRKSCPWVIPSAVVFACTLAAVLLVLFD